MIDHVRVIARCVRGFEWLAADEITERLPGADGVTLSRREIAFRLPAAAADLFDLFDLRTVDDVFIEVGRLAGVGAGKDVPATLADRLAALPWEANLAELRQLRQVRASPLFDVVASLEGARRYNRFAVEHAFGALFARITNGIYLARTPDDRPPGDPHLTVRIFIRGESAVAALRLGARPLHRRSYKQDTGPGTLHPPVAAALARLAHPHPDTTVSDPFCGDGTIAIETALTFPHARIHASDIDPVRVAHAARNAERAGARLAVSTMDATDVATADRADAVITNPPWNLAVDAGGALAHSLDPFWRRTPHLLAPDGRLVALTDAELDVPTALRRVGLTVGIAAQVRLAGRVSHVVLAGTGDRAPPAPDGAALWRERAVTAGVVTDTGY